MKRKILPLLFIITSAGAYSQVGIGTLNPNKSAQLEVEASDKGVLIPRVQLKNTTDKTTVVLNDNGTYPNSLLVYATNTIGDITPGYYFWQDNRWVKLLDQSSETLTKLTLEGSSLQYLDEKGNVNSIDLTNILKANSSLTKIKAGNNVVVEGDGTEQNSYSISVPLASSVNAGVVKKGEGVNITDLGEISVSPATKNTIGGVIVGKGLDVAENGTISVALEGDIMSKDNVIAIENGANSSLKDVKLSVVEKSIENKYIADNAVETANIVDFAVTTNKIATAAVTTDKIADETIQSVDIKNESIKSEDILNGEIKTEDIATKAVTNSRLADNAVWSDNIKDREIQLVDLALGGENQYLATGAGLPNPATGQIIPLGEPYWANKHDLTTEGLIEIADGEEKGKGALMKSVHLRLKKGKEGQVLVTKNGQVVWEEVKKINEENGASSSAKNGVSINAGTVKLGGPLTENTTIVAGGEGSTKQIGIKGLTYVDEAYISTSATASQTEGGKDATQYGGYLYAEPGTGTLRVEKPRFVKVENNVKIPDSTNNTTSVGRATGKLWIDNQPIYELVKEVDLEDGQRYIPLSSVAENEDDIKKVISFRMLYEVDGSINTEFGGIKTYKGVRGLSLSKGTSGFISSSYRKGKYVLILEYVKPPMVSN